MIAADTQPTLRSHAATRIALFSLIGAHQYRCAPRRDQKEIDPDGLFFVHNGVGSDHWSTDGVEKL